ncbi:MAG: hypothetical protein IJU98_06940 [Synergistaceae bacterium]|nr:hypothetical protein [Synergistaceae bacterium]
MNEPNRFELLLRLEAMTDDDIDCSDIPEVTDFSNWRPAREHIKRIATANYQRRREITRQINSRESAMA